MNSNNNNATTNIFSLSLSAVEDFFYDNPNTEYTPLPPHSLQQSPCRFIIDTKVEHGITWYYCKLHPQTEIPEYKDLKLLFIIKTHIADIRSIYLDVIEHHCKFYKKEIHKKAILDALKL